MHLPEGCIGVGRMRGDGQFSLSCPFPQARVGAGAKCSVWRLVRMYSTSIPTRVIAAR